MMMLSGDRWEPPHDGAYLIILSLSGPGWEPPQDGAREPRKEQPGERHPLSPEHEQLRQQEEAEEAVEADLHRGCAFQVSTDIIF